MFIKQLYTSCLSEAAYYIESEGEAAVIDPLRETEPYLTLAAERKATIKYVFETHFHADFVSGHIDLGKATGAPIVFGPNTETRYSIHKAKDGEVFELGKVSIEVLHTPGHTLESTCYLLRDEAGTAHAIFTGDTLFVGDVGRPDLSSGNLSREELASMMYDSLQNKILPLPDSVLLYPAHGPGSSCGKNLGPNTHSTIGDEKQSNYALQPQSREDFIKAVTDGLTAPPQYFPINARINKEGYDPIHEVLEKGLTPLDPAQVKTLSKETDAIILDTRPGGVFMEGFVPGSIFIGLEGRFAEWAGSLLPFHQPLIIVAEAGKEEESVLRLARVGFDQFLGYLKGGFEAWRDAGNTVDMVINIEADEFAMDIPFDENMVVMDVRKEMEYADGHVKDAVNVPLDTMMDLATLAQVEENDNVYLHCASGYRSVIAASLMKRQGIHNIRNIAGGYKAIKEQEKIEIVKDSSVLN
ncbi:rhodanese-like domain-containing protein [Parasegetibacter sp. NRK P23]|uniref:MBL fold metallo-hydrolase n=1 Tax=Parasegetibacter sp. NRK P23 TaxID=2942999 RepID=UPI0020448E95|nr:MBL fold metallo-hydrolase [Parasegetibacter sp. NRK P23]MCM5527419.1 MBL fold metallo-hydrolase [Parasegetibacter sp. NRK P23]